MAITKVSRGLLSTGISDSSDATAITIDSSEQVTLASNIHLLGSVDQRIQLSTSGSGSSPNTGDNNCHVRGNDDILILNCAGNGNIKFQENGTEKVNIGLTTYNASDRLVATNTSGNASMTIVGSTSGESSVFMADGTSGDASYRGYIQYQHTNDNMNFGTAGAERMRIDSSGNLLVGTTSAVNSAKMSVNGNVTTFVVHPAVDNNFDVGHPSYRYDDIRATNGTIQTSDRNEKNTITDSDLGLDFVKRLSPKSYKFNNKKRTHYGLIAQDIETVLTDISKSTTDFAGFIKDDISEEQDGSKLKYGLRYTEFVSPLIKAIQEQQIQIEALQSEINTLKGGD